MLSVDDNERLTRTGPGTPMGAFFRRFWMPVLLCQELPEPDGPPVRVKVMGEDLVAFRDTAGRPGLLDPRCPHRGANLFFGRNEECGLRCAYHGWKFDVNGRCVDMPTMPRESRFRDTVRVTAYPTREWGDFVWAYLGPPELEPALPELEFALVPPAQRFVSKKLQQCNWAQACEGGIDTAHFSFLHMPVARAEGERDEIMKRSSADRDRTRWMRDDPMPVFHLAEHDAGLAIGAARRADGADLYWRVSQFLLPNHGLAPNAFAGENYHGQTWVPIRNRDNDYLIDRLDQKHFTFTGIRGVSEQDACIQDSQGVIADRTREHLGPTDAAIIRFRRMMLAGARRLAAGVEPAAARRGAAYAVRSGSAIADRTVGFEDVMIARFGDPVARIARPAPENAEVDVPGTT